MSILDDAIREHLELKRAHGADEGELQRLQDEAFGPPQRPDEIDPFAEAPTEFLPSPQESPAEVPEIADEHERSGRRPDVADLQEAPPADEPPPPSPAGGPDAPPPSPADAAAAPPPSPTDALDAPPPPPPPGGARAADLAPPSDQAPAPPPGDAPAFPTDEDPGPPAEEPPAAEEQPAGEREVDADAGPSAAERHAIADQPTQMFDVQAHVDAEAEAGPATGEQASPTDEELVDAGREEPQAAPPAEAEPEEGSAEFDFFNEQRLSDELDQALEAPLPPTDEHLAMPRYEDAPGEQGGIFDFESQAREEKPYEDDPSQEVLRRAEEAEAAEEPPAEEPPRDSAGEAPAEEEHDYDPETGHEDVLEDTPRFLEDQPEDDDLWFEQKPPKDFDLD